MLYTINPQSFNAVMACSAVDDVRYYLNSFFVDVTNNRLVAANGHVLAMAPFEKEGNNEPEPDIHGPLKGFLFQRLRKPISNKGDRVYIDCGKRTLGYQSGHDWKEVDLAPVDGRFVDYTRVTYSGDTQAIAEIAFNTEYVAKPARWAGFDYCAAVFEFNGQLNAIGVQYQKPELTDVRITLMPVRI